MVFLLKMIKENSLTKLNRCAIFTTENKWKMWLLICELFNSHFLTIQGDYILDFGYILYLFMEATEHIMFSGQGEIEITSL